MDIFDDDCYNVGNIHVLSLKELTLFYVDVMEHKKSVSDLERIKSLRRLVESGTLLNYVNLLPLALNLDGKPYTLDDHFPFEPAFNTYMPPQHIEKCGRQVSKSMSAASKYLIECISIPYFRVLFVTPLYDQIRRFSTDYVRKLIDQSPIKDEWIGTNTENSVLQRSFKNFSKMYFSFALLSADRIRGISCDAINFDEIQDMDASLIPIIRETTSASKWGLTSYKGTPKTLDNTIEGFWQSSSQAEWSIPCTNCKKLNIPAIGYDVEKMIGPLRDDISEEKPGIICAQCRLPIQPKKGRWLHAYPERRHDFPGYHVPQIIMPMHYNSIKRWGELLAKQAGCGNTTINQFYNEVLGEGYDTGAKLITKTELQAASILPWENEPLYGKEAIKRKNDYILRILGVDWGGGGEVKRKDKKKLENITMSFTCCAVLGLRGDGKIDVIYGRRLLTPHDHQGEAQQILRIYHMFNCNFLAHDYNGAGNLRETIMVQAGLPLDKLVPIVYTRSASQDIMVLHASEEGHSRNYYLLDKARSLQLVCQCIKLKQMRFFKFDYVSEENRGLQHDFLSLMENKQEMARGADVYMIQRNPHYPDDFTSAVTYAATSIWYTRKSWPNLAHIAGLQLTADQMSQIAPVHAWGEGPLSGLS